MYNKNNIKILVMDVDGTLTDGQIYMGENGEVMKSFNVKDGYAIKNILPEFSIIPVIITARESKILDNRCSEIGIEYVYQNVIDKRYKLNEVISELSILQEKRLSYENIAYIGDDLTDMKCMATIADAGGISACPGDAVHEIKEISSYICEKDGGHGAVREFIEWMKK